MALTSARRYLDLLIDGKIDTRDSWHMPQKVAVFVATHTELRDYAYGLLKDGTSTKTSLLASAVAEGDDPDGLVLLVELENKLQRALISWRTIRGALRSTFPPKTGLVRSMCFLLRRPNFGGST